MIRVILADDHPIVLLGVRQALEAVQDISIVATAHSSGELFSCLAQHACDVVVTDYSMPSDDQPDGLAMVLRIRNDFPMVQVVVLTKITSPAIIAPLLQSGALALVEKSARIDEISTAIRRAAAGNSYFTESVRREFATLGMVPSKLDSPAPLSPRETEVLRLFASGYTNNQIADLLGVSAKTTSRQKHDAMRKLAARNDAELLAHARELGLV
jgi:two-component system capsular synthesis response regulator RcsB